MFVEPVVRVYVEGEGYMDPKEFVITPSGVPLVMYEDGFGYLPEGSQYFVEQFVHLNELSGQQRKLFEGDIVKVAGNDPFDMVGVFFGEVILEDGCAKALEIGGDNRIEIYSDNFFREYEIVGNTHGAKYHK